VENTVVQQSSQIFTAIQVASDTHWRLKIEIHSAQCHGARQWSSLFISWQKNYHDAFRVWVPD